ncbi:hypothetical protein ACOSP7_012051 [Xanthoceras sorbifolium]
MPQQWGSPCGNHCTSKFSALTQIPWRVFCKKACTSDGETWEECLAGCDEICYKDPVLKDHQWSAYIDRSPGSASYSAECFTACVSGCAFKFDMLSEKINQVRPNSKEHGCYLLSYNVLVMFSCAVLWLRSPSSIKYKTQIFDGADTCCHRFVFPFLICFQCHVALSKLRWFNG